MKTNNPSPSVEKGYWNDRYANVTLILVSLRVSRDNFAHTEYDIRLMLAPRSAKALQEKVLLKFEIPARTSTRVTGMVIAGSGVGATRRSAAHMGLSFGFSHRIIEFKKVEKELEMSDVKDSLRFKVLSGSANAVRSSVLEACVCIQSQLLRKGYNNALSTTKVTESVQITDFKEKTIVKVMILHGVYQFSQALCGENVVRDQEREATTSINQLMTFLDHGSKPNGKLIYNSIMHGPYVRRMILEPGDPDREVPIAETFHQQTGDELIEKEVKQMEADDQAVQIILMGFPKNVYAVVDSCETAQGIWLRIQQMMKGYDIGIQDKKAKLFNERERFTSTDRESIESYYHRFSKLMNDFKRNKYFPEKIASNLKFLNNLQPE
nr:hypothetical protein [Tanacetum cinerariifolium]